MAHIQLAAEERTQLGTSATRRLRRQGRVPGILYQVGKPSLAFSLAERDLRQVFHGGGRNQVIEIAIGGGTTMPALLKDWQMEPVREQVLHVDLQQVDLLVAVETTIGVVLTGQAVGVREGSGILDQTLRSVMVRALPDQLPESIEGDVTPLEIGGTLLVGDLMAPDGVEILDDPETTVASVLAPSVVEEPEEAVEPEDGAEPAVEGAPEAAESEE